MTNSVTFPVNLGGDGSTVTDDDNASTGLGNGGHRTRFVPAMGQVVAVANTLTQRLAEQSDTSTTSLTIATGSKSFVTAGFYEWAVGMYVVAASTSSPANRMYGQVTSWTTSTNTLVVNVLSIDGSGTFSSWTVSLSGPPNLTTLPNVISVNSVTDALRITQLGTGNALLVEDSSNPDATPFVIDANGNLGLGVTPSGWGSTQKAIQIGSGGFIEGRTSASAIELGSNAYINSSNAWTYQSAGAASYYAQWTGAHYWYTAPSGTAGAAISFTQAMTLDANACLGVGETSPSTYAKFVSTTAYGQPAGWFSSPSNTTQQSIVTFKNTTNDSYLSISGVGTSSSVPTWANGSFVIEGIPYSSGNTIFSSYIGALVFQTNGRTERARIDSSGNLLVGTTSSSARLVVSQSADAGTFFVENTNSTVTANIVDVRASRNTTAGSFRALAYYNTGAGAYKFYVIDGGNLYSTSATVNVISDQRLKENVRDLDTGLKEILALRPRRFDWKENQGDGSKDTPGFIAQEVEQVMPELVVPWNVTGTEADDHKGLATGNLIPTLVKAIQELSAELNELKQRIN